MHDPLADVVIPASPCPPSRTPLREWYEEAETLPYLRLTPYIALDPQWWREHNDQERRERVRELHGPRRGFRQIAAAADVPVEGIGALFTIKREDAPRAVAIEACWQAKPDQSMSEVAAETGYSRHDVKNLLRSLGVISDKLRNGGGYRHGPEVYDTIERLRAQGRSWSQIGKAVGLGTSSVAKMWHRRHGAAVPS